MPRPALSVCLFTDAPAARVRAILAPLATLEPEVVLAIDERASAEAVRAYAGIADRFFLAPYAEPPERSFPWLHAQCSGEWILRLDGDEVVGHDLAQELASVIGGETAVTHAIIPRRWLYRSRHEYLTEWPWQPDGQVRLVRNDPAVLRVPGTMHSSAEVDGARRYLRGWMYHADLLLKTRAQRVAKTVRYDAERPGLRMAGRAFNAAYYLPEERPGARTAAVPEPDRPHVAASLDPPPVPAAPGDPPTRITRRTIDGAWPGRPLEARDYGARIDVCDQDPTVFYGEERTFDLQVRNEGTSTWSWGAGAAPEIRIGQRWILPDGERLEGARTLLPEPVSPGQTCRLAATAAPPPASGPLRIEFDVVHEHVRWFGAAVTVDVVVQGGEPHAPGR